MLRRTRTTWLWLALLPYLCITLLASLPHQHDAAAPAPHAGIVMQAAGESAHDCLICQWHTLAGAVVLSLPVGFSLAPPVAESTTVPVIISAAVSPAHPSRAPPVSWC